MNELRELLLNPITIIALLLAVFFILMAYLRNIGTKRRDAPDTDAKPYNVTDPYALPKTSAPPPRRPAPGPTLTLSDTEKEPAAKVFRQFGADGSTTAATRPDNDGYVWE